MSLQLKKNESLVRTLLRRKRETDLITEPKKNILKRELGLFDLVSLGVGSTLGLGAYVLAGEVSRYYTGPAVILSFAFAAAASALSGLCYAEFASRVPKAGSAYAFSYVGVGELVAFLIGWDLILEYSIGCASVSRALSGHIDKPFGYPMKNYLSKNFPINVGFLAPYPDVFSFIAIILLTGLIAWGIRESSILNKVFTIVNVSTVAIVVLTGFFHVDFSNWNIPKNDIPDGLNGGEGGFLPFGWSGVFTGAATCFYGFVGFDVVATTGEEAKKPTRDIPLSIVISLVVITTSYCSLATVLTLMWPYYDQDPEAPFTHIYQQLNWTVIEWIVTIGAVFALCTNMIGTLYPLPRVLYAMSSDGLMFKLFSKVNLQTKTPVWGTIICGLFAATLSSIFDLQQLMNMMSIGTLMAYTLVCFCVLILRYTEESVDGRKDKDDGSACNSIYSLLAICVNSSNIDEPTKITERTSITIIIVYLLTSICFSAGITLVQNFGEFTRNSLITIGVTGLCLVIMGLFLSRQPQSKKRPLFKVPWVPFVPCMSIVLNIYLMTKLDPFTWVRFTCWLVIGSAIYAFYGYRYSVERFRGLATQHDVTTTSETDNMPMNIKV
ncbi:high affinity cationic amino acid transporter 1-like isoform X2 [Daktulosphaira vitifoliae]|uniref:high affinity cationic amino acid transporter 1-like isoform X2 n=1 Tax=Daktulosphaira vitifoliae TaxID=58002 RepID=UPI0021A9EE21|nr:high affinity cationic amino acid transporter 1-like isoform X2 [Daktulosphaira vitifoliae]